MNGSHKKVCRLTASAAETRKLAGRLAASLDFPAVLLLQGDVGSGKTTLVKGLVDGLGGDPDLVHSPTFSLVNQYQTPAIEVLHIDLYRLENRQQQYSIGLDELLKSDGLVVIEWAEKLRLEALNPLHIRIDIRVGCGRHFAFSGLTSASAVAL